MLQFSSEGGIKEYPITSRQVSPSPVNLYINFALSLRFMALKEFVPAPQTHVSLFRTLRGVEVPGGKKKKQSATKRFHFNAAHSFCIVHMFSCILVFEGQNASTHYCMFSVSFICEQLLCFSCEFVHFSPLEKKWIKPRIFNGFPVNSLWKFIRFGLTLCLQFQQLCFSCLLLEGISSLGKVWIV